MDPQRQDAFLPFFNAECAVAAHSRPTLDRTAMQAPQTSRASAYIVGITLTVMALGILVPFFLSVIGPYLRSGVPPADWTPFRMLIALAVVVGLFACLGFTVYQRFDTVMSERGLSVPTIRGRREVLWSDIQRVGVRGHELLLAAPTRTVVVNTFCFTDAKGAAAYVHSRLASATQGVGSAV